MQHIAQSNRCRSLLLLEKLVDFPFVCNLSLILTKGPTVIGVNCCGVPASCYVSCIRIVVLVLCTFFVKAKLNK